MPRTRKQFIKTGQLAAAVTKIYGKKPIMVMDYNKEATKILPRLREMGLAYPRRFTDAKQKASIIRGIAARIGDHNKARGYSKRIRQFPHKDPQVGAKAAARAKDPVAKPKKRTLSKARIQKMIDAKKAKAEAKAGFVGVVTVSRPKPVKSLVEVTGALGSAVDDLMKWANQIDSGYNKQLKTAESLVNEQQAEIKDLRARLADVKSVLSL